MGERSSSRRSARGAVALLALAVPSRSRCRRSRSPAQNTIAARREAQGQQRGSGPGRPERQGRRPACSEADQATRSASTLEVSKLDAIDGGHIHKGDSRDGAARSR